MRQKLTDLDRLREAAGIWEVEDAIQIRYLANVFTQVSLPYKDPGDVRAWGRRNGHLSLTMTPGHRIDQGNRVESFGYPYGVIPRLLLTWVSTVAVQTGEPILFTGHSMADFLRELGMKATGGKNGTITRLREQAQRLFRATMGIHWDGDPSRDKGASLLIASAYDLSWDNADSADDTQQALFTPGAKSYIHLSAEFFNEVRRNPVPLDLRAMRALRGSALRLDLYAWLTYRMSYLSKPTTVAWDSLQAQFGYQLSDDPKGKHQFKKGVIENLAAVLLIYPEARVEATKSGLLLKPSPPHVPFRGLRSLSARSAG